MNICPCPPHPPLRTYTTCSPVPTCAQAKTRELKTTLNAEFRAIHELCMFVLSSSRKPELLRSTLAALAAYLSWVPPGYIFESALVPALLELFPQPPFRNTALQCLTEVGQHRQQSDKSGVKSDTT
jgi:Exportin 1-like protein